MDEIQTISQKLTRIAENIQDELPKNTGFALLIFDFNTDNGRLNYVSNAARNDIVQVMKEFIEKVDDNSFGKDI